MCIIQWNANGLYAHLPELQQMISKFSPYYVCIQESRLNTSTNFHLKNFTIYRRDRGKAQIASGGVATLVHNSIHAEQIILNTEIEAVAVTTVVPNMYKITLCNIYLPPNYNFTNDQIDSLIQQLPRPFILLGDFNSHNTIWGSNSTNTRGRKIESILDDDTLILNDGSPTHFCAKSGNFSAIDLTFTDATIAADLN